MPWLSGGPETLLDAVTARVNDTRPLVHTGFGSLDSLFHRGGWWAGTLVILAGRSHTRKTTTSLNMVTRMLEAGTKVGLVGLDESPASYGSKLLSAWTGTEHAALEDTWNDQQSTRGQFIEKFRDQFTFLHATRPTTEMLSDWLVAEEGVGRRPQVVFLDYLSKMHVADASETQRIQRLAEDLQVWAADEEIVLVALHQVGRSGDFGSSKYHGANPLTAESLKYGGEEQADIVLGVYRPALDQLGNMTRDMARVALGENFKNDRYEEAARLVSRERANTYVQLLKNRPGNKLSYEGVKLVQNDGSLRMAEGGEQLTQGMVMA